MSKTDCGTPELIPLDFARDRILHYVRRIQTETISLAEANNRVLAKPLLAQFDSPAFNTSTMDGYAVNSQALSDKATTTLPVKQRIAAGDTPTALKKKSAARIFTGAPVPEGADTVVMQERCTEADNQVTLPAGIKAGENVLAQGENYRASEKLCDANLRLLPFHIGLAASQGYDKLEVYQKLKVALINTGNELVMPGQPLNAGQIYNSNQFTVGALLERCGCEVRNFDILADTLEQSQAVLKQAAGSADIVITTGGVSVGEEDHIRTAVASLGQIDLWRVRIKPGKPFAFGHIGETPFIGLPGNPVSSFITFCMLARPYIQACQGIEQIMPKRYVVRAGFQTDTPDKRDCFRSARLIHGEELRVQLLPNQNSASLAPLLQGDGLLHIPANLRIGQGMTLDFYPFCELM